MVRDRHRHVPPLRPPGGAKVLRAAAAAFLAVVIGGCAYLSEKQGELIFRPTKDVWRGFDSSRYTFEEHWIQVGNGSEQKLHAWWLKGDRADAPVVLYLHGARWNLTGSVTRIDRWRQLGFAVLAVDYRGFGKSSDIAPTEEYAYEDAEAAWDYLAKIAPNRPRFIVGHSLGGAIAAELAKRRPDASGLVLEATFTSVREMIDMSAWSFLPVGLILTQEFDTLSKIPDVKVPVLITHGTRDSIVPFAMGEKLYNAAKGPKRFIRVEGAGHHNLSGAAFDQYRVALGELFGVK
ncbi:MAG TPA: alpha/beta fold hydrolase [Usitatibacter sp.]|nr:alpha/beta fold hydrolase [Usitatibacter sp.]